MAAPVLSHQSQRATLLADPALREGLLKYARQRLPAAEVEDLVQNTLTEAWIAVNPPSDPTDFGRWVRGIARHKIADSYRSRGRLPVPSADLDQNAAEARASTGELSQWVESELPKTAHARATLHWLLREGDGESLDEIARDVDLPAPRVRQRVSRLRRHFHARWLALGAGTLLCLLGLGALVQRALSPAPLPPSIAPEPELPLEQARRLRLDGLERCAAGAYRECIAALDRARMLDPLGEGASAIREARAAAARNEQQSMRPDSAAEPTPSSLPSAESAAKQRAPHKLLPKPIPPSKSAQKPEPFSAPQQQNALPHKGFQQELDDPTGSKPAAEAARSKKLSVPAKPGVDKR